MGQTPGAGPAQNAADAARNAGGNLGMGAAPLPEPSTWIGVGTLLLAVTALVIAQRRRRKIG